MPADNVLLFPYRPSAAEQAWAPGQPLPKMLLLSAVRTVGERLMANAPLSAEEQKRVGEVLIDIAEVGLRT